MSKEALEDAQDHLRVDATAPDDKSRPIQKPFLDTWFLAALKCGEAEIETIRSLVLEQKADPNVQLPAGCVFPPEQQFSTGMWGCTALHIMSGAIRKSDERQNRRVLKLARMLVTELGGADSLHIQNDNGETPMVFSILKTEEDPEGRMLKLLAELGGNLNDVGTEHNLNLMHLAAGTGSIGKMSVLYDLDPTCIDVQSPAVEPSGPGSGSLTPLMLALDNNKIDAAAWLLSKGANT
eukprot:CAMPEP_0119503618 /NCGR_PEP_ID=MMETSP1344-20130328/24731_1 /TAXON_ID=236787 /ORGANISM="Florenciella parvula, Strain CCMP2471" /LENGTH=236 /DNA_ID=CAMNT_0007539925 /DNA_START=50 /DNA_END=758 /DNA_ORIENTATION=+